MQSQTSGYIITTLITSPASAGLTSLANIKDDLDIAIADSSNDARLTRYLNEESANIAGYCNRVFGLATWQDEFRPQRGVWGEGVRGATNPLKLSKWPLIASVVTFTGSTHSSTLVDGLSTITGLAVGQLVSGPGIVAGTTISSVNAGAGSLQLSSAATATSVAVPLSTGISIVETVAGTDTGLTCNTDFEITETPILPGIENESFVYRLNQQGNPKEWPQAKITVVYQAGYALPNDSGPTLPSDLQGACLRIINGRFQARKRDPMLRAQGQPGAIGSQQWWVGATPGQTGPYPNEIMIVLERYRTPVVG